MALISTSALIMKVFHPPDRAEHLPWCPDHHHPPHPTNSSISILGIPGICSVQALDLGLSFQTPRHEASEICQGFSGAQGQQELVPLPEYTIFKDSSSWSFKLLIHSPQVSYGIIPIVVQFIKHVLHI